VVHQTLRERNSAATAEHRYKPLLNVQNAAQKSKLELSSAPTVEQKSSNSYPNIFIHSLQLFAGCLVNLNLKREMADTCFL
jgi:hypothetical protein